MILAILTMVPYPSSPDYESIPGYYSTGAGFGDVDMDGDPDLFISNGNDMEAEPNQIYFNDSGSLSISPDWSSADFEFSGHLSLGDINGDGFIELAVSNYTVRPGWYPANSVIYKNENGVLDTFPFFITPDSIYSFSCDFGDIDGDGDLDIAYASGEIYTSSLGRIYIYKNEGGEFDSIPCFKSIKGFFYDIAFTDIDLDGDLDLVAARHSEPLCVFLNDNGYDSIPNWVASDTGGTIGIDVGDVNQDGFPDVVAADNAQMPIAPSRVKLYLNNGGTLTQYPVWTSTDSKQYYSTVALADIDFDGDLDLGAGGWWEPVVIFENTGGTYNTTPDWSWGASNDLVCEKVVFQDVNMDGLFDTSSYYIGKKLIIFERKPIFCIDSVKLNGTVLPQNAYCYNIEDGWLSVGINIGINDTLEVFYRITASPDLFVSNWSPTRGNFLFYNTGVNLEEKLSTLKLQNRPTSIITKGEISLDLNGPLSIYDISGRRIFKLSRTSKKFSFKKHSLPRGVYFIKAKGKSLKVLYIP